MLHHRRSIRLKEYDYSQEGLYFITICCQDRAHLFGHIENGEMILNDFGKIAHEEWANSKKIRDNIHIHEYIIMPNHIHGIIEILFKKDESKDLKNPGEKISESDNSGGINSNSNSTGELLFAPTAPTAPTARTEIKNFKSPSQTIGSIIRGYKIATIKKIKDSIIEEERNNIERKDKKEEIEGKDKDLDKNIRTDELISESDNLGGIISNSKSTGELQFAPTVQTAPTEKISPTEEFSPTEGIAPTELIKNLDFKIWQRNYYEHIIRDEKAYHNISSYIINNPKKWKEDKFHRK